MGSRIPDDYYTSRKSQLLKDFDRSVERTKGILSRYGGDLTDTMIREARQEYEALIPQLPYVGGKQPFTQFIIATGWYLTIYRVLKAHGKTIEEIGKIIYEVTEAFLNAYPRFLRRLLGGMGFSRIYLRGLRKRAAESQKRRYPGDWVYTFVDGGKGFDYGVDYTECGVVKFLDEQGASELAPYVCPVDILYSQALGWGLVRTMTLAEGYDKCDFRFKKGGETRVAIPGGLREVLRRSEP